VSRGASPISVKTLIFTLIVVLSNAVGNLFLTLGMKHEAANLDSPLSYITAIFHPMVALGIGLLILWMLSRMALLSWADLSFVLPVTALGYVLSAILGMVFLTEQISLKRWAGILLIVAGVALVGWKTRAPEPVKAEGI